jgi:hypothetical protein
MERSTSPKDVLALGRQIVNELQLDTRGSVAARWLAHHVAELIQLADSSEGPAQLAAQERAVTAILRLWAQRRDVPADIDPLNGYRRAIEVLGSFASDSNPWSRYHGRDPYEDLLSQIFDALQTTVVAGVLLTRVNHPRPIRSEEVPFVEPEEAALHAALTGWISVLRTRRRSPKINIIFRGPDSEEELMAPDEPGPASIITVTDSIAAAEPSENDDPASIGAALLAHLEAAHEDLGKLITLWKEAAVAKSNESIGPEGEL